MRTGLENDIRLHFRLDLLLLSMAGLFDKILLGILNILNFFILATLQGLLYFTAIFIFLLTGLQILLKLQMHVFKIISCTHSRIGPLLVASRLRLITHRYLAIS